MHSHMFQPIWLRIGDILTFRQVHGHIRWPIHGVLRRVSDVKVRIRKLEKFKVARINFAVFPVKVGLI